MAVETNGTGTAFEEEAQGFAHLMARELGLSDLIVGGLAVYSFDLLNGQHYVKLASTGYTPVDIALLACAAAFVGKIIGVAGTFVAAVVELFIERFDVLRYTSRLERALMDYAYAAGLPAPNRRADLPDTAGEYLRAGDPRSFKVAQHSRKAAISVYRYPILLVPYADYVLQTFSARWVIVAALIVALACLGIGIVSQLDYVQRLGMSLRLLTARDDLHDPRVIEFRVKTASDDLPARQAARLIASLVVIRDALSGNAGLFEALKESNHLVPINAIESLRLMGRRFMESPSFASDNIERFWADVPEFVTDTIIQGILAMQPDHDTLSLVSLKRGSAIGVIKDSLKMGFGRLRRLLPEMRTLLPGRKSAELATGLRDELRSMQDTPPEVIYFYAGVALVGTRDLSSVLRALEATDFEVISQDDQISSRPRRIAS